MNIYSGNFFQFSEMGMEGMAYGFEDIRGKYLSGYEVLDVTYFFKIKDSFPSVTISDNNQTLYEGPLSFTYNAELQAVIPKEIDVASFKKMLKNKNLITLSSEKVLYEDKIIIKMDIAEKDFLVSEINKLLSLPEKKVPANFVQIRKDFSSIKDSLSKIESHDPIKFNFNTYISTKQSFLFGSSPIEVVLRGDGSHLVEWLKSRTS